MMLDIRVCIYDSECL